MRTSIPTDAGKNASAPTTEAFLFVARRVETLSSGTAHNRRRLSRCVHASVRTRVARSVARNDSSEARSARSLSLSSAVTSHAVAAAAKTLSTRVDVSRTSPSSSSSFDGPFKSPFPHLGSGARRRFDGSSGGGAIARITDAPDSRRARVETGAAPRVPRVRRCVSFRAKPSLPAPRVAAQPTTPSSEKRALPKPRRSPCQSPTSFMRRASQVSSPRGVGRGTETCAARRRDACFENVGGTAASSLNVEKRVVVDRSCSRRVARHVPGARRTRVIEPAARFERGGREDARGREGVLAALVSGRSSFFSSADESGRERTDRERSAPGRVMSVEEPRETARDARGEARCWRWRRGRTDASTLPRLMRA